MHAPVDLSDSGWPLPSACSWCPLRLVSSGLPGGANRPPPRVQVDPFPEDAIGLPSRDKSASECLLPRDPIGLLDLRKSSAQLLPSRDTERRKCESREPRSLPCPPSLLSLLSCSASQPSPLPAVAPCSHIWPGPPRRCNSSCSGGMPSALSASAAAARPLLCAQADCSSSACACHMMRARRGKSQRHLSVSRLLPSAGRFHSRPPP